MAKTALNLRSSMWKKVGIGAAGGVFVADKFLGGAGLALWGATDNVMGQTGFYSKTVADNVIFNGADPEEALRILTEESQESMDAARKVVDATKGLPYTAHYQEAFTAAGDASQAMLDLNIQRILDFMKGGK